MRVLIVVAVIAALAGCRGEPVPRDYQNAPPDVSNAPQKKSDTPAAHGMGQATPENSTGHEGTAAPYEPVTPPAQPMTTTMDDQAPAATTPTSTTT